MCVLRNLLRKVDEGVKLRGVGEGQSVEVTIPNATVRDASTSWMMCRNGIIQ